MVYKSVGKVYKRAGRVYKSAGRVSKAVKYVLNILFLLRGFSPIAGDSGT